MPPLTYELQLTETADSTGYFAAAPDGNLSFPEAVAYLRSHPGDEFMHKHILGFVQTWDPEQLSAALSDLAPDDHVIRALVLEAALLNAKFGDILKRFSPEEIRSLAAYSPLVYIRHTCNRHQAPNRQWISCLGDNIQNLAPLTALEEIGPELTPTDLRLPASKQGAVPLSQFFEESGYTAARFELDPEAAREIGRRALEKLAAIGILEGDEMRHTAALSPIALLRKWRFAVTIRHRSLHYVLSGLQTSYGRGLHLDFARTACAMEIIERCSSFAGIEGDRVAGLQASHALLYGSLTDVTAGGAAAVDPQQLGLETDYTDQELSWIQGADTAGAPVHVPLQSVFLFANYDEPALYSGLGSTGLASGTLEEQARLNGMLEVIERDADGTTPYDPERCFLLTSGDPHLEPLLTDLQDRSIHVWFQDITPDFGVPAYRCLVQGTDGAIYRGTSAHLDGKKAVISALTETPYPYPDGAPTRKPPEKLPTLDSEALPCFSTSQINKDYRLLTETLVAHGMAPVFVDLTRRDLDMPVIRAIIPGLESQADFDSFSRVHPRLFRNYLNSLKSS